MNKAEPLSILHIDAEKEWAGGEEQVFLLTHYLNARGHQTLLACPPGSESARRGREDDFDIRILPMRNSLDLAALVRLARLMLREKVDVVHFHTARAHKLGVWAARFAKVPVVVVTRRMDYALGRHFITDILYRRLVDRVIAISKGVEKVLLTAGIPKEKVEVVVDGIDVDKFNPARSGDEMRRSLGIPQDVPVVGINATLTQRKGHHYFLRAAREVIRELPRTHFLIAGDGPLRGELEVLVRRLGLAGRVIFTGHRDDVVDVLAAFDVLVLTSVYEGLGVAILEGMAMGKPIVASRVGGIPESTREGVNGFLVPPRDYQAVADRIRQLLKDRSMAARMGKEGRKIVEEEFSSRVMARQNESVYYEVLRSKRISALPG